jgi:hypothetical protein
MSTERRVPVGDTPTSVSPQPNPDGHVCHEVDTDAGDAARMVVSSRTEVTLDAPELPALPPEAARSLLRLVREAQQRAAARATKGAA